MNEIDKYTKEELYDMCNALMHTKESYESMLDVYDEMVTWYERKIEERNAGIRRSHNEGREYIGKETEYIGKDWAERKKFV